MRRNPNSTTSATLCAAFPPFSFFFFDQPTAGVGLPGAVHPIAELYLEDWQVGAGASPPLFFFFFLSRPEYCGIEEPSERPTWSLFPPPPFFFFPSFAAGRPSWAD